MADSRDDWLEEGGPKRKKWCVGVLNEKSTDEVPGSVILLSRESIRNEPLGLNNIPARTSRSSLPPPFLSASSRRQSQVSVKKRKKTTPNGKIILEPQPEDTLNDPLNWPFWRRNAALFSLGFYCMILGGLTPVLAAGFGQVAATFHVSTPKVALTTGIYMLGLGLGGVLVSPTAIIVGKRPMYLATALCLVATSSWCALSPTYASLVAARFFQGMSVSPGEVLPSATVAEIFFLHERAFRLGIYTLLLIGGKNLVPVASAMIIEAAGWRWVFWAVAIVVGFCFFLLFFLLPETFFDRSPRARAVTRPKGLFMTVRESFLRKPKIHQESAEGQPSPDQTIPAPELAVEAIEEDSIVAAESPRERGVAFAQAKQESSNPPADSEVGRKDISYTDHMRVAPPKTFRGSLRLYSGKLSDENWFLIACRPFLLFAYPAVLWSATVYALSVGWLIVLSECIALVYENRATYNFSAVQTGLVYLSPFIGCLFGTAIAGKFSDVVVRFMARRNDGVYEPEFRLVMAIPITIASAIGLMGFGWSAQERDSWIVPTVFFGIVGFSSSLGSTTAITFVVDSYRQYAGEALVTLNFSKNVLHGFVFSLFFPHWFQADGSKSVFMYIGLIQILCMLFSIPMYIYGKRLRMWTARKNFVERLLV